MMNNPIFKVKITSYLFGVSLGHTYDAYDENESKVKIVNNFGGVSWISKDHCAFVYQEPVKQASTFDSILTFTKHHKDIEITFEDGMIKVRDWYGRGDPVEYKCDTVEQLEELMSAWEVICKFRGGV